MSDMWGLIPEKPKTTWPHKCSKCGCFVKLSTIWSSQGGYPDYDYDASAECTRCGRRVDAWPI